MRRLLVSKWPKSTPCRVALLRLVSRDRRSGRRARGRRRAAARRVRARRASRAACSCAATTRRRGWKSTKTSPTSRASSARWPTRVARHAVAAHAGGRRAARRALRRPRLTRPRHVPRRRRPRCASGVRAGDRRQSRRVPRARGRARRMGRRATIPPDPRGPRPRRPAARGSASGATAAGRSSPTCAKADGRIPPRVRAANSCRRCSTPRRRAPIALHAVAAAGARYNGFNLLAGDAAQRALDLQPRQRSGAARARAARPVERAARHAVAETRTHDGADARVDRAARTPTPTRCSRRSPTARRRADDALPATGVTLDWERLLSSPFIVSDSYGTRCSTIAHDRPRGPRALPRAHASTRGASPCRDVVETFRARVISASARAIAWCGMSASMNASPTGAKPKRA